MPPDANAVDMSAGMERKRDLETGIRSRRRQIRQARACYHSEICPDRPAGAATITMSEK